MRREFGDGHGDGFCVGTDVAVLCVCVGGSSGQSHLRRETGFRHSRDETQPGGAGSGQRARAHARSGDLRGLPHHFMTWSRQERDAVVITCCRGMHEG